MSEQLLINYFYAHNVGHAIEALYFAHGYHAANPEREIAVALNGRAPVELAGLCDFVSAAYPIDHPVVERCVASDGRLAGIPRRWTWVVDDHRRFQREQLELLPGLGDYYAASDRYFQPTAGRSWVGHSPPSYERHHQLRLQPPSADRLAAAHVIGEPEIAIAIMPAGSGDRALYPSVASWTLILDALIEEFPRAQLILVGKRRRTAGTSSSLTAWEHAALIAHRSRPLDCFDLPLARQLAVVEACDLFLAPHTGFGMAALAVGTPWLALSGGPWFEYFFNRVRFRSIIPDTERYPAFSQLGPGVVGVDDDGGARTPSMTIARVRDDVDQIVSGAIALIEGAATYDECLHDYFRQLQVAVHGDTSKIWSIDEVHLDHVVGEVRDHDKPSS